MINKAIAAINTPTASSTNVMIFVLIIK